MAKKVLYREWRPKNFDEVVGQSHIVQALRQSALSGEIAHAYLFSGTRGTGKTSLAKIFSRAINCQNPDTNGNPCNQCDVCTGILEGSLLDVIEMDAASNNSVDNIRKITDEVLFLPSLAQYKVYIIDEVHMLSTAAFNALLKTLEEPPQHVVFILATTDPQRIPATILSRCQRYDFRRIPTEEMQERLRLIANKNNIEIDDQALELIVSRSEGALRDAISILDQSQSVFSGAIHREQILEMTGAVNDELLARVVQAIYNADVDELLENINSMLMAGADILRFLGSLAAFYRDLLICKTSRNPGKFLMQSQDSLEQMMQLAKVYSQASVIQHIQHINRLQVEVKQSLNPRISLELGLIQLLDEKKFFSEENPIPVAPMRIRKPIEQSYQASPETRVPSLGSSTSTPSQNERISSSAVAEKVEAEKTEPGMVEGKKSEHSSASKTSLDSNVQEDVVQLDFQSPTQKQTDQVSMHADEDSTESAKKQNVIDADASDFAEEDRNIEKLHTSHEENSPESSDGFDHASMEAPPEYGEQIFMDFDDATPSTFESEQKPTTKSESVFKRQSPEESRGLGLSLDPSDIHETSDIRETQAEKMDVENSHAPDFSVSQPEADIWDEPSPVNMNYDEIWEKLMTTLSSSDPVLAILMNGYHHEFKKKSLFIEIPEDRRAIYDKIRKENKASHLEQLLKNVAEDREWRLLIRLAGEDPQAPEESFSSEPEWIQKIRKTSERLGIALDREEE